MRKTLIAILAFSIIIIGCASPRDPDEQFDIEGEEAPDGTAAEPAPKVTRPTATTEKKSFWRWPRA